jgi:hypothetical protein
MQIVFCLALLSLSVLQRATPPGFASCEILVRAYYRSSTGFLPNDERARAPQIHHCVGKQADHEFRIAANRATAIMFHRKCMGSQTFIYRCINVTASRLRPADADCKLR